MNVLAAVVIPPHLAHSGAVNAALALSRHLGALDDVAIDVALMADRASVDDEDGFRLLRRPALPPLSPLSMRLPNKARTLFYRSDIDRLLSPAYDLLHLHNPIPALEMHRIARAAIRIGMPYVVSTHGFVEAFDFGAAMKLGRVVRPALHQLVRRPLEATVRSAGMVLALSPVDAALVTDLGYPADRVVVVPNGVERTMLHLPPEQAITEVCRRFGLDRRSEAPRCFFLANHTANKGLDVLMDAAAATAAPFELIIGGSRRDLPYEAWQQRLRPGQRMVVTDRLADEEIHALHHLAELFVFPSRADTLPLVLLEAMAARTPVLSTTVGGIPTQVVDGCGWLVPPGDSRALCAAWERALAGRSDLAAIGEQARAHVEANFDWVRSAHLARDAYQRVLGELSAGGFRRT